MSLPEPRASFPCIGLDLGWCLRLLHFEGRQVRSGRLGRIVIVLVVNLDGVVTGLAQVEQLIECRSVFCDLPYNDRTSYAAAGCNLSGFHVLIVGRGLEAFSRAGDFDSAVQVHLVATRVARRGSATPKSGLL